MEDVEKLGLNVKQLMTANSLSGSMRVRLQAADVDGDGVISAEEVIRIIQSEAQIRKDNNLLKKLLIALGISCILIIAAVAGLTYAVVSLSKDTSVQSGMYVSKASNQPLSTGKAKATYPLKDWYMVDSLDKLSGMTNVVVPFGNGIGMFTIDSIQLVPGQSILIGTTTENVTVLVDETGITVTGDLQSNSTARRQLLSVPDSRIVGDVTVQLEGDSSELFYPQSFKLADYQPCQRDSDCMSNNCTTMTPNPGSPWRQSKVCYPKTKVEVGGECSDDSSCASGACGYRNDDAIRMECCSSTTIDIYGRDYCKGQAKPGESCFSDDMCDSGKCKKTQGFWAYKGNCDSAIQPQNNNDVAALTYPPISVEPEAPPLLLPLRVNCAMPMENVAGMLVL